MLRPGRRALFSKLNLELGAPRPLSSLNFRTQIDAFDPRFSLLRTSTTLSVNGEAWGNLRTQAFVRPALPTPAPVESGDRWKGRTVLILGGSRGLGAALSRQFAAQGARVLVNFERSADAAERLHREIGCELVPGNAADLDWCARTAESLSGLDLLVCNACPPMRSLLSVEPSAVDRISSYVTHALSLVTAPLAAFLPKLRGDGRVLVVSSNAARHPPPEWPHYVAAKRAVEGLTEVAAAENPQLSFTIARPPKLLTDMTNNPMARLRALSPDEAAQKIRVAIEGSQPGCRLFEDFGG
jgi:NAD(P)-dependent dehydrogenase (short-subunit alcohol dehydrogenase family)